jgi:hypothetical protein
MVRTGAGLAGTLVTAIGRCLWALGGLGAALCAIQFGLRAWTGRWPVPAVAWSLAGRFGALVVLLFRLLPLLLTLALAFHLLVAWLGYGLYARRAWGRRATLAFCTVWAAVSTGVWLVVRPALADYAQRFPEQAQFAAALSTLATEILVLVLLLAGGLALLLTRPSVRAQF